MVSNPTTGVYIQSTSDMTPKWEDNRIGADLKEMYEIVVSSFNGVNKIFERRLL